MIQLSEGEEKYIQTIPEDRIVVIKPYNKRQREIADEIIAKVKNKFPKLDIYMIGASALEISGQGDLDIQILAILQEFSKYLPTLIEFFGEPKSQKPTSVRWEFEMEGYQVELYLATPEKTVKKQFAVFEKLRDNRDLRLEYEQLKENFNGKSVREYQRRKYEFYHRILEQ